MRILELHELAKIAYLHYREDWTQEEIALRMGMSRFKVMRGLKEAKERGIVVFEIDSRLLSSASLEVALERTFGLRCAVVVALPEDADNVGHVAAAGAEYLGNNIESGSVVGLSWGPTVGRTVAALRKQARKAITVVELLGGVSVNPSHSVHAIALAFAQAFDSQSRCYLLECPAIVRDSALRDSLMAEQSLRTTMDVVRAANVAVFSTGDLNLALQLLEAGYITSDDLAALRGQGAAGNVYARFFNNDGQECDTPLKERTLGLSLDEIKSIESKICICCGPERVTPLLAALRGGLVNVLITDKATAQGLLSLQEQLGMSVPRPDSARAAWVGQREAGTPCK